MKKEDIIRNIESMQAALNLMLHIKDITQDGYDSLNMGFKAWIEQVNNLPIADVIVPKGTLPDEEDLLNLDIKTIDEMIDRNNKSMS